LVFRVPRWLMMHTSNSRERWLSQQQGRKREAAADMQMGRHAAGTCRLSQEGLGILVQVDSRFASLHHQPLLMTPLS
jgi:hypothetical protein